jgi:uncharacterized protein YprB with RNaseH-like and TPR domain
LNTYDSIKDRFSRVAALRPARKNSAANSIQRETLPVESDGGELARLIGATVQRNRFGEHLVIRRWYATPEPCLDPGDERGESALRLLLSNSVGGRKQSSAKRKTNCDVDLATDPSQWLFLDTETTGLVGGSGTYAFLVGLAWWESGGLQVEQLFMRDFGEEHSLLLALDERLAERRVLVTFNGKSFDWPLLDTRFRMTRSIAPRTPAAHLDFLHPARQLWRPRLNSVRLSEIERHVLHVSPGSKLDWTRDGDMNSGDIPEAYFSFVRGGFSAPLVPVFQHNQMDLRGLAALAGHILDLLGEEVGGKFHLAAAAGIPGGNSAVAVSAQDSQAPLDLFGLSRLLDLRGESERARKTCRAAVAAGLPVEHDRVARRFLARSAKRAGDLQDAVELWESLLGVKKQESRARKNPAPSQSRTLDRILLRGAPTSQRASSGEGFLASALEACEQLAIHFERHARSLDRATELTRHGLTLIHRASGAHQTADFSCKFDFCHKCEARFERRLIRLERKATRASSQLPMAR